MNELPADLGWRHRCDQALWLIPTCCLVLLQLLRRSCCCAVKPDCQHREEGLSRLKERPSLGPVSVSVTIIILLHPDVHSCLFLWHHNCVLPQKSSSGSGSTGDTDISLPGPLTLTLPSNGNTFCRWQLNNDGMNQLSDSLLHRGASVIAHGSCSGEPRIWKWQQSKRLQSLAPKHPDANQSVQLRIWNETGECPAEATASSARYHTEPSGQELAQEEWNKPQGWPLWSTADRSGTPVTIQSLFPFQAPTPLPRKAPLPSGSQPSARRSWPRWRRRAWTRVWMPCWPAPCWWERTTSWWGTSKRAWPRCGSCWTTVISTTRTSAASSCGSCTTTSRWTWSRIPRRSPPPQPPSPAGRQCPCPATSPGTCNRPKRLDAWDRTLARSFIYILFILNDVFQGFFPLCSAKFPCFCQGKPM